MKKILVIGIGSGHPEQLTIQAVNALNQTDVFFFMDKGPHKQALNGLRRALCERYISARDYRIIETPNPERMPGQDDYLKSVEQLNTDKQAVFARLIGAQLREDECGAFMVWGDPSLYDSTLRILDALLASGQAVFEYEVIPGITSVQALTARHKIPLNTIGGAVHVTTGRRLHQGMTGDADSVVVLLDADNSHRHVDQALHIYWGAYLGTAEEILISGALGDVAEQIIQTREAAREANGWIMDTYVLKRGGPAN